MPLFIDFHTHSERETQDCIEVVSVHPDRWKPCRYYTLGFHPWWTDALLTDAELENLKIHLSQNAHCLALGECGLDKLKGAPLPLQERIFRQQIELANSLNAPIIVHCVRTYDTVLKLHRQFAQTPWVVHGYRRHAILAKNIIAQGLYLSVAPDSRIAPTFLETLQQIPLDRLFIETDSDPNLNISEAYNILATIKNVDICTLQMQVLENFKIFFKWKIHNGWSARPC